MRRGSTSYIYITSQSNRHLRQQSNIFPLFLFTSRAFSLLIPLWLSLDPSRPSIHLDIRPAIHYHCCPGMFASRLASSSPISHLVASLSVRGHFSRRVFPLLSFHSLRLCYHINFPPNWPSLGSSSSSLLILFSSSFPPPVLVDINTASLLVFLPSFLPSPLPPTCFPPGKPTSSLHGLT